MSRRIFERRLEEVEGLDREASIDAYLGLLSELDMLAETRRPGKGSFKTEAAEAFVELLWQTLGHELSETFSSALCERIRKALYSGPDAIETLRQELQEEILRAIEPQKQLEGLRKRHLCLRLRQDCLEHLNTIFSAERAQP